MQQTTYLQPIPQNLISEAQLRILNQNNCQLARCWKQNKMQQICPYIKQWKCSQLWAYNNQENTILKEIQNIQFTKLVWISLSKNKLTTIEGIERIYMPNLQGIYLTQNQLISILPLRKLHCPKLCKLGFFQNLIIHGNEISELKMSSKLEFIQIELGNTQKSNFLDSSIFLKIEAQKIQYFQSKDRIGQKEVNQAFFRKYQDVNLATRN